MGVGQDPPTEVVVELDGVEELFAADPRGLLAGARRIDSGVDELVERFLAQKRVSADQRIVLDIASECDDEQVAEVVSAVRRYFSLRLRRATREHDLIWRQGKRALLSGSSLFVVGIGLSYLFTRPEMGGFANELLGNGVFLVVAWVGLWYPLDLLFIAREQAKREMRVLGNMLILPIAVRAEKSRVPHAAPLGSADSPGLPPSLVTRFRRFRGPSKSGL